MFDHLDVDHSGTIDTADILSHKNLLSHASQEEHLITSPSIWARWTAWAGIGNRHGAGVPGLAVPLLAAGGASNAIPEHNIIGKMHQWVRIGLRCTS